MKVKNICRLFPLLLILLISSCSWFNNSSDDNEFTLTISGTLTSQGAFPELLAERTAARTATVSTASGTLSYTVDLLASETATTALTSANATTGATNIYYEMKYTPPSDSTQTAYFLRANAKLGDTLILQSAVTPVTCNFTNQVFTQDLELRPTGTGDSTATGTVLLPLTLETPGNFTSVSIDNTSFTVDQTSLSSGSVTIKNTGTSIPAGIYSVRVSFYKSATVNGVNKDVLVYQFSDVINIFNGLETNTWVDNGNCPHLTTTTTGGVTTTQCKITDALLESFKTTNFYVDNTIGSNGKGTFYEPFNSLNYAITYINGVGNDTDTYTVHVKANDSGTLSENFSGTHIINKNITIECYKTLPGAKDGRYTLNHYDNSIAFSVYPGKTLTFESNGGLNSVYTDGIQLALVSSSTGVSIAQGDGTTPVGRFVMKGGGISGGGIGVRACGIFEMYGGGISACNTGVLLDYASSEMIVSGTPYIYNNTGYDVKIQSAINISVTGPLTDGTRNALIGIYKSGTPTITAPVVFTSGYGYQTGGYNAGIKPGRYFRGADYGVTFDSDNTTPSATYGEAVLALSGGKINIEPLKQDVQISIDKHWVDSDQTNKDVIFTAILNEGSTPTALNVGTTTGYINLSYALNFYGETVPSTGSTYYSTGTLTQEETILGKFSFKNALPAGKYSIMVTGVYGGKTYSSSFDVLFGKGKTSAPGIVTSYNMSSTSAFNGRTLTLPNIIASDHEVTQEEFEKYCNYKSSRPDETYGVGKNYPAYFVNWYDALLYCNLRSKAESLTEVYIINGTKNAADWPGVQYSNGKYKASLNAANQAIWDAATMEGNTNDVITTANGWRLPVEVEWVYLAYGGNLSSTKTSYSGSNNVGEVAWYGDNSGDKVHEVKGKKPNELGLYDMTGNVSEICWDWSGTTDADTPIAGPTTAGTAKRLRGASYRTTGTNNLVVSYRSGGIIKDFYSRDSGFRVVRNAD